MSDPNPLGFVESPTVTIASNTFIDVPVILQYDAVPLIEVVRPVDASFTTRFRIYNDSGDQLAAVDGTQIYLTDAGTRSQLTRYHPAGARLARWVEPRSSRWTELLQLR